MIRDQKDFHLIEGTLLHLAQVYSYGENNKFINSESVLRIAQLPYFTFRNSLAANGEVYDKSYDNQGIHNIIIIQSFAIRKCSRAL